VALANLEIFRTEHTLAKLKAKISRLSRLLKPLLRLPHVGEIRQQGFMAGIELVRDRGTRQAYPLEARIGHRVAQEARTRGLLLRPLGHIIVLMPPLSVDLRTLARMVDILSRSIIAVTLHD
jgi:adenosylmethionine-8-amino-7-oxononanoate aminotransferase